MTDPVFCLDGQTYERIAIQSWLNDNDTSPNTNLVLQSKKLIPNHALRALIADFEAKYGVEKLHKDENMLMN